jgi:hypothetical protein
LEGRPSEFLGGVGRFTLQAEARPTNVRVGQELDLRITVTGPAAWGMTARPELKRYDRLSIGLRIEPKPDEITHEPPARTFVYRLRPVRAAEAVLPPVAIAAFDPGLSRFITQVTAGVPVRVVAVPTLDPAWIGDGAAGLSTGGMTGELETIGSLAVVLLVGVILGFVWVRRRASRGPAQGPAAARQYAARLARSLRSDRLAQDGRGLICVSGSTAGDSSEPCQDAAHRVSEELVHYLLLGTGRPTGALTPAEAQEGVAHCTGSDALGAQAAQLAARCDGILYRDAPAPTVDDPHRLLEDARGLFAALGRVQARSSHPPAP